MYDDGLTWIQRRELERELWLEDALTAIAAVRPEDLDDVEELRAVEHHARVLVDLAGKVRRARGDHGYVEQQVVAFAAELDAAL